ncbi:MAG: hypothetical protein JWP18_335 [Solirubrobacterales bacterium]|nr:hypothetical protein [Solirubrobacterales bacterium]
MSTPPLPPEDRPTEMHAPVRVPREPVAPVGRDPYAGGPYAEAPLATAALADSVRTLRNGLALLALLSVATLLLALYALNEANSDDSDSKAASQARVAKLEDRVSRLVTLVKDTRSDVAAADTGADTGAADPAQPDAASAADLESVRASVKTLDSRVSELQGSDGGDDSQSAIDALGQRIDQLSEQVQELQTAQQQAP